MPFAFIATLSSTGYEFDITVGPLPNYVDLGDLVVNLKTIESDGDFEYIAHAGTYFKLYVVTKTPVDPQAQPWIGVLEDSCTWAKNKVTPAEAVQYITRGLYSSGKIIYGPTGFSVGNGENSARNRFALPVFLQATALRDVFGDCYDTSNYLSICFASQGVPSEVHFTRVINGFQTNSLSPIGYQNSYIQTEWENHQMVEHFTLSGDYSGAVADACLGLFGRNGIPVDNVWLTLYWHQPGTENASNPWLVKTYLTDAPSIIKFETRLPVIITNNL